MSDIKSKLIKANQFEQTKNISNKIARAVGSTLGPGGRTVAFRTPAERVVITKDGVSVAKNIKFKDNFENIIADTIKEIATSTNEEVGDGTTSSIVLADAFLNNASEEVLKMNPNKLKSLLSFFEAATLDFIKSRAIQIAHSDVVELKNIALISSNGDKVVGDIISKIFNGSDKHRSITVENSKTSQTLVDNIEGYVADVPYMHPGFITEKFRDKAEYKNARVLISLDAVESYRQIAKIANDIDYTTESFVIVAKDFSEDARAFAITNNQAHGTKILFVRLPGFGEDLIHQAEDLAFILDAAVYDSAEGNPIETATKKYLGSCEKVLSNKAETIFFGSPQSEENIEAYYQKVKELYELEENQWYKANYGRRLARLKSGVSVVYVGGYSDIEQKELYDRVEDAVNAVQSALKEGIHEGGGMPLLKAGEHINNMVYIEEPIRIGELEYTLKNITIDEFEEVKKMFAISLAAPWERIRNNSTDDDFEKEYEEYFDINSKYFSSQNGIDFSKGEYTPSMIKDGIIDPVLVTVKVLEKSLSIVKNILSTDYILVDLNN